jgi:hypothetical protein
MQEIYEIIMRVEVDRGTESDVPLSEGIETIIHDCFFVRDEGGKKYFRGHIIKDSLKFIKIR